MTKASFLRSTLYFSGASSAVSLMTASPAFNRHVTTIATFILCLCFERPWGVI